MSSSSDHLTPNNNVPSTRVHTPHVPHMISTITDYVKDESKSDRLYCIIVEALQSLFNLNCLHLLATPLIASFEKLLQEHYEHPHESRLRALVPGILEFFTPLPFAEAFRIYNEKYCITQRRFVPPTFQEIRHIMNIAQVMAVSPHLKLVTFDGDETLYPNGKNFDDTLTAQYILSLLDLGCYVAVVTAAGYGYQVGKYETRLGGLLQYLRTRQVAPCLTSKFFLFGGESNYLMRCNENYHIEPVPESEWRRHVSPKMQRFFDETDTSCDEGLEVRRLLNTAVLALEQAIEALCIRAIIIRKARAVGLVPGGLPARSRRPRGSGTRQIKPEILEEVVFRVRQAIEMSDPPFTIPYCAFNGGLDVWVDVGNKAEAIYVLQSYLNISRHCCLHIGDQFSHSGNDTAARNIIPTLWIRQPSETRAALRSLLCQLSNYRKPSNLLKPPRTSQNTLNQTPLTTLESTTLQLESEDSSDSVIV